MSSAIESTAPQLRDAIAAAGGLLGQQQVAELLGVSRQRVGQLLREAPDFPDPVAHIAMRPVWLGADITAWQHRRSERLRKRRQRGSSPARYARPRGPQT